MLGKCTVSVSLFNGILTSLRYLITKCVHSFIDNISPKVNVIHRQEY